MTEREQFSYLCKNCGEPHVAHTPAGSCTASSEQLSKWQAARAAPAQDVKIQRIAQRNSNLNKRPTYQKPAAPPAPPGSPFRAAPAQPAGKTALERFNELKVAQDESDPVEQLRAFCSLAMTGQDWLDVEPFFDAVLAARAAQAQPSNEWLSEALRWQAATAEAAHLLTDRGGGYIFIAPDGTTIESSDAQDFVARVRAALKNADHS